MATFKHNKKRNTGLVYEFLVRRLSKAMVDQDKGTYQKTLEILRKYYSEGTVLSEERELFDVIRNTRGVTESAARRILGEVQNQARKMDAKKIDIKKSNLIKEINYTFGQEFFGEHRVPEYRLLASIQMVVDACRGTPILTESVAKIQLEEGLVQYMTTKGDYTVKQPSQNEVDTLVMKMVAKRFEEKYSSHLSPSQKSLLERYVRYQVTGDARPLKRLIDEQAEVITTKLTSASVMKEIIEDQVMSGKLSEAASRWASVKSYNSLDAIVEELMLYQKLVEELDSNE